MPVVVQTPVVALAATQHGVLSADAILVFVFVGISVELVADVKACPVAPVVVGLITHLSALLASALGVPNHFLSDVQAQTLSTSVAVAGQVAVALQRVAGVLDVVSGSQWPPIVLYVQEDSVLQLPSAPTAQPTGSEASSHLLVVEL